MAYDKSTLELVLNAGNDMQITFTEYFYRRLAMGLLTSWDGSASYQINNSDTLVNGNMDSGIFKDAISNIIDWSKYPRSSDHNVDYPADGNHYPIGGSKAGLLYNLPIFYKVVFGMVVNDADPTLTLGNYNANNSVEDSPKYYDGTYNNPWYYYTPLSLLGGFSWYYPPSWHVNPTSKINGGTTEDDLLNAVPWGNLIPRNSNVNISLNIEPQDDNAIEMLLDVTFNKGDVIDTTSTFYQMSSQYRIVSMAVVDFDYQPLILATFPIIPLMVTGTESVNSIFKINFGNNLLQP